MHDDLDPRLDNLDATLSEVRKTNEAVTAHQDAAIFMENGTNEVISEKFI